jgi:hypothetical protein
MSCGARSTLALSSVAFFVVASQSVTPKYGIQCGGTPAPFISGVIAIIPPAEASPRLKIVYSIPGIGLTSSFHGKSPE